jgi:hypothetical protein
MASPNQVRLTSPRGRLVQGDAFEAQTKDQSGAPLTIKTGPNAGQPTKRWFIAVAYPKNDPETNQYLAQLGEVARKSWPAYMAGFNGTPPTFGASHPRFSTKIMDGDGTDDNGKSNREKPGFAGHWVVKYSTSIKAPGVWQEPNFDEMDQITDPRMLPRGYFVRVNHTADSNENDGRPGLYVNLDKIAICANQTGAEIIQSGPTAAEAFGGGGGNAAPPAPGAAPAPPAALVMKNGMDYAAMKAAGWSDDQMIAAGHAERPAPAPLPVSPPPAPPAPTPGASIPPGTSGAGAPPPPPATPSPSSPPPPPYGGFIPETAPTGPKMTAAAGGATYEQMIAAGWTDAMLKQHGMME